LLGLWVYHGHVTISKTEDMTNNWYDQF